MRSIKFPVCIESPFCKGVFGPYPLTGLPAAGWKTRRDAGCPTWFTSTGRGGSLITAFRYSIDTPRRRLSDVVARLMADSMPSRVTPARGHAVAACRHGVTPSRRAGTVVAQPRNRVGIGRTSLERSPMDNLELGRAPRAQLTAPLFSGHVAQELETRPELPQSPANREAL